MGSLYVTPVNEKPIYGGDASDGKVVAASAYVLLAPTAFGAGELEYRLGQLDLGQWDGMNFYSYYWFESWSVYGPNNIRVASILFNPGKPHIAVRFWPDPKAVGKAFLLAWGFTD